MTLSVAKIIQCRWWRNEWLWSVGGMILKRDKSKHLETWFSAT